MFKNKQFTDEKLPFSTRGTPVSRKLSGSWESISKILNSRNCYLFSKETRKIIKKKKKKLLKHLSRSLWYSKGFSIWPKSEEKKIIFKRLPLKQIRQNFFKNRVESKWNDIEAWTLKSMKHCWNIFYGSVHPSKSQ